MGLPLSDDGYTVSRLQTPFGERLKLLGSNGARAAACKVRKSKNILKESNTSFMTFILNDIKATTGRAISFGATSMGSIVKIRPDLVIVFMLDPEGNYIELAQYDDISQYRPDLRLL